MLGGNVYSLISLCGCLPNRQIMFCCTLDFKDLLILLKYRKAIKTPICLVENHFQVSKSLLAYWFTLYIKNLGKGGTEQWC